MKRRTNLQIFAFKLSLSLLLMGCNSQIFDFQENSYKPINLDEIQGSLTGDNPETMTFQLFGTTATFEENFSQEIEVIKEQGFEKIILFTKMNLPDDSVKGIRYRLQFEFDQSLGKWRLKSVGRQQSCYRSNFLTNWTIEPCP